jgi:two-component sensor histidine kinase
MLLGPPVELAADLAVPVGMALHELTTNAVRYGALSVPEATLNSGGGWVRSRVSGSSPAMGRDQAGLR